MRQTLAGGRAPSSALVRREEGKGREEENSNSLVVFLFFFLWFLGWNRVAPTGLGFPNLGSVLIPVGERSIASPHAVTPHAS